MKVVILAGGFGTRISEESYLRPKPMIEIGEMPILWHIMKGYSEYGYDEFIICSGYKQRIIKEWFANYFLYISDITFDFKQENSMIVHEKHSEKWKVTIIDTGFKTMTGGRVKRIQKYIGDEPFHLTYGDAVSNVDIDALTKYHFSHGKIATLTSISLTQQKGILDIDENDSVVAFREKEDRDSAVINGGFMVFNPEIFNYLEDDSTVLEQKPMRTLASEGQLKSYFHKGFWQCMDTKREKDRLENMWASGNAPWKTWND